MPKLPDIKNLSLKDLFNGLIKNLSWLFLAAFLILLVMETFEVKQSVQIILSVNSQPQVLNQQHGVRIDFVGYNKVLSRMQNAQNFVPDVNSSNMSSPFGTGPVSLPSTSASTSTNGSAYNDSSGVLQVP